MYEVISGKHIADKSAGIIQKTLQGTGKKMLEELLVPKKVFPD